MKNFLPTESGDPILVVLVLWKQFLFVEEWSLRDWLRCVWGRGAETFTHFGKLDEFAKLILMRQ